MKRNWTRHILSYGLEMRNVILVKKRWKPHRSVSESSVCLSLDICPSLSDWPGQAWHNGAISECQDPTRWIIPYDSHYKTGRNERKERKLFLTLTPLQARRWCWKQLHVQNHKYTKYSIRHTLETTPHLVIFSSCVFLLESVSEKLWLSLL